MNQAQESNDKLIEEQTMTDTNTRDDDIAKLLLLDTELDATAAIPVDENTLAEMVEITEAFIEEKEAAASILETLDAEVSDATADTDADATEELEAVTIYSERDYQGKSHRLPYGRYNTRDLGIGNNALSSLRVPKGQRVTIFTFPGFAGAKMTYTRNTPDVGAFFNNKTSSIIVSRDEGFPLQDPAKPQDKVPAFIYSEANYRGKKQALFPGRYNSKDLSIGNDSLSALRIPDGLKVTIFEDPDFSGSSMTYHRNTPFVGDFFNNKTSSLIVAYEQSVKIFSDTNYLGDSQTLEVGRYNIADLGIGDNSLSAIQVPRGLKVTIYEHADFKGTSMTYTRNTPFVGEFFNDKTSSIIVDYAKATDNAIDTVPEASNVASKRCLQFDGYDDHISVDVDFTHSAHTLSLWFKTSSPDGGLFSVDARVLDKTGQDRHVYLQDGNLCARLWNDEIIASKGKNYADNQWHKVSHVFGGDIGAQCLYVDGELQAQGEKMASNFFRQTRLYIGYSNDAPKAYFKGLIAEVALWSHARSAHSLRHWKTAVTGYESNLLGFWNCQYVRNGSTQINDHSPYAHHGKIQGAASSLDVDDFPAEFVRQIMQTPQLHALKSQADAYAGAGTVIGQGYKDNAHQRLHCKALSQWIAQGELAQYKLMTQLNSAVHNGKLHLNAHILGTAYADIVEHIPMLDIFSPIAHPKCGFFKNHPGYIGNAGTILHENPDDCAKLATLDDYALKIAGDVKLLGIYNAKLAYADFSYVDGMPQCAFKYQLEQSLPLNALLPAVPLLDNLNLDDGILVASSSKQLFDPELDVGMEVGLNFFGQVDISHSDNPRLGFLNHALQNSTLKLRGIIDPSDCYINADLASVNLVSSSHFNLDMSRTNLRLSLMGQPVLTHIALQQDLKLSLQYQGEATHLFFNGGMILARNRISNAYSMNGQAQSEDNLDGRICNNSVWENPLGIQGLKIHRLSIKLDCQYEEDWLENVGIHGGLQIGQQHGHIALMLSNKQPEHYVLRGEIEGLQLQELLEQLAPDSYVNYAAQAKTRNKLFKALMNTALQAGQIHIVPEACRIGGMRFREAGLHVYGEYKLWGAKAHIQVNMDKQTGMDLRANLEPVQMSSIFSLKQNEHCAPALISKLSADNHAKISVDAKVSVLGLPHSGTIQARQKGLCFNLDEQIADVGHVQLKCHHGNYHFKANGVLDLLLNTDILSDYGIIPLREIHCVLRTKISMDREQGFVATLKGNFVLWNQVVSLPKMQIYVAPRDFHSLHQRVIKLIKDNANHLFEDLLFSLDDWRDAVLAERIQAHEAPAAISHGVYRSTIHTSSLLYHDLKQTADTAALDLRAHYQTDAASLANALRYAGYADKDIIAAVEGAYGLGVSNAAIILKKAGFDLHEIAQLLKGQYQAGYTDLAGALKNAGYGLADIGDCLREVDALNPDMINTLLKQVGFAEREIKVFFMNLGGDFALVDFSA